jgi:hypothetical protein
MRLWVQILFSALAGWLLAGVLLSLAIYLNDPFWSQAMIWHWKPIYSLAGNGPLLHYDAAGNPIYEGTPIHLLFNLIGVFAGFVIYPILFVLLTSIVSMLRKRKTPQLFSPKPPPPPMFA